MDKYFQCIFLLAAIVLGSVLATPAFAQGHMCPNGTYVDKGPCKMCPDGSYIGNGGSCRLAPNGAYIRQQPDSNRPSLENNRPRLSPGGSYIEGGRGMKLCPNGQYVAGSRCKLMPDGSYIGID